MQKESNLWADPNVLENLPQWILSGNFPPHQQASSYSVKPPRLADYIQSQEFREDVQNPSLFQTAHILGQLCTVYDNLVVTGNWYDPSLKRLEQVIEARSRFWFALKDPAVSQQTEQLRLFDFRDWDKYVNAKFHFHERFYHFDPKGYQDLYGTALPLHNLEYLSAFIHLKCLVLGAQIEKKASQYLARRWFGAPLIEIENTIRKIVFQLDWGIPEDPKQFVITEGDLKTVFQ